MSYTNPIPLASRLLIAISLCPPRNDATGNGLEIDFCPSYDGVVFRLFRAVTGSITRVELLCRGPVPCGFVCQRPGPGYRWSILVSHDVAVSGGARSSPSTGQSVMVAVLRRRG